MEHNLRLRFQLSCSLNGYTMGATTGFHITTMEALAPQPYH
jgi:hypothetical protein